MISRRHMTALRKAMSAHCVQPRTQKALIEKVEGGLFRLEVKNKQVALYLNNRRFEFSGTGLISANQPENRRV